MIRVVGVLSWLDGIAGRVNRWLGVRTVAGNTQSSGAAVKAMLRMGDAFGSNLRTTGAVALAGSLRVTGPIACWMSRSAWVGS